MWITSFLLKDNGNKNFYSLFYSIGINGIEELCFFYLKKANLGVIGQYFTLNLIFRPPSCKFARMLIYVEINLVTSGVG